LRREKISGNISDGIDADNRDAIIYLSDKRTANRKGSKMMSTTKSMPVATPDGPTYYTLTWGSESDRSQTYDDLRQVANQYHVAIQVEAGPSGPAHVLHPKASK
jgi:hypothetical protein